MKNHPSRGISRRGNPEPLHVEPPHRLKATTRHLRYCGLIGMLALGMACDRSPEADQATDRAPAAASGDGVAAQVGERQISESQVAAFARLRGRQGMSSQVRQWALSELIDLTLLAAEAEASGLLDEAAEAEIEVQRLTITANMALAAFVRDHPVSDAELSQEYERQIGVTGTLEYRLQHILAPDEEQAAEVLARLAAGEAFEALMSIYAEHIGAVQS